MVKKKNIKSKKPGKYVHEGFSWNLRGPIDEKSKAFVLAANGVIRVKPIVNFESRKAVNPIGKTLLSI